MKLININWEDVNIAKLLQFVFFGTLISVLLIFSLVYYKYTSNLLKTNIDTSLRDFAISAQYIIDGDKHQGIKTSESIEFEQMCEQLAQYKKDVGVYDVYTILRTGENTTALFLAAYDAKETFMQNYIFTDEIQRAFSGEIVTTKRPYKDSFGTFYSGYAPLYNSNREIVAIVAVDINVDSINALKQDILMKSLLVFILCFIIGSIMIYFMSKTLAKSFRKIIYELKRIGDGDLSGQSQIALPMFTEMRELENTINDMAVRISALIEVISISAANLKDKSEHILELIINTDTSNQIMASTIEQMSNVNSRVAKTFEDSLEELISYKEESDNNIKIYTEIFSKLKNTNEVLCDLKQDFIDYKNLDIKANMEPEFQEQIEKISIENQSVLDILYIHINNSNKIYEKRESIIEINSKISNDLKLITSGNKLVVEAMEKQVEAIQGAVSDVEDLKNIAKELNSKIKFLKIKKVESENE